MILYRRGWLSGGIPIINMINRINNIFYKYYIVTWVFILILFKRQIPKWMRVETKSVINDLTYPLLEGTNEKLLK